MYRRCDEDEDGKIFNEAEEAGVDQREQHCDVERDADEKMPVGEDEEQDLEAIALEQTKRYCGYYTYALRTKLRPVEDEKKVTFKGVF